MGADEDVSITWCVRVYDAANSNVHTVVVFVCVRAGVCECVCKTVRCKNSDTVRILTKDGSECVNSNVASVKTQPWY